jgi:hypothetical protein
MVRPLQIPTHSLWDCHNWRDLNVARVGKTHINWSAVSFSNWKDGQTGLVTIPILWRCLLRQQCPVIRETRILTCFLGMTHEIFGCLQLWVFNPNLRLSIAVKCDTVFRVSVNDSLSIHILDNWNWHLITRLWSSEVGVWAHFRQPISLFIALNVAVTWHPKQSHPVVIFERSYSGNQHWCRILNKIL